ncbi:MAG: hypothetical protein H3C36_00200, partial [Chitinophagaceae bacterium]|nr:hypothetical protein [Chitinophagaceae bacterium]
MKNKMIKAVLALVAVFSVPYYGFAQSRLKSSVEIHYGLSGNFFVKSYDESQMGNSAVYLYKKRFLGTIGGIEYSLSVNDKSSFFAGYSRSINKGRKNYAGYINEVDVIVSDFSLRHINDFWVLGYDGRWSKSVSSMRYQVGMVYARMHQQEIAIEEFLNQVIVEERDFKNSALAEIGVLAGVHVDKAIDTHFKIGVKARIYYLVSSGNLEAFSVAPTLT